MLGQLSHRDRHAGSCVPSLVIEPVAGSVAAWLVGAGVPAKDAAVSGGWPDRRSVRQLRWTLALWTSAWLFGRLELKVAVERPYRAPCGRYQQWQRTRSAAAAKLRPAGK